MSKVDDQIQSMGFASTLITSENPSEIESQFLKLFDRVLLSDLYVRNLEMSHEMFKLTTNLVDFDFSKGHLDSGVVGFISGANVFIRPALGNVVIAYPCKLNLPVEPK